jgi:hypothetical protein
MKAIRNLFPAVILLSFVTLIFLVNGCKKDENKPAPDLPPQSSFLMDFSDFSNPDDTLAARDITTYQNWGYSYANVAVWNAIITIGLAVPVASFLESFNHEAVYHPDQNKWTWSYNVTVGLIVYEAELTGYLETDSVIWEMRITKGTEYTDFLWYYGWSDIANTGGFWYLYENPESPNKLLKILWARHSDGTEEISYTNVKPGAPENGGYIFYGTVIADFDRFYDIYNKGQDNLTEIEWSSTLHNGHVKDPLHFGDDQWHCWDTNLVDIVCP